MYTHDTAIGSKDGIRVGMLVLVVEEGMEMGVNVGYGVGL